MGTGKRLMNPRLIESNASSRMNGDWPQGCAAARHIRDLDRPAELSLVDTCPRPSARSRRSSRRVMRSVYPSRLRESPEIGTAPMRLARRNTRDSRVVGLALSGPDQTRDASVTRTLEALRCLARTNGDAFLRRPDRRTRTYPSKFGVSPPGERKDPIARLDSRFRRRRLPVIAPHHACGRALRRA